MKIHTFIHRIKDIKQPKRFTYPFQYEPHPLSILAAEELKEYLLTRIEWKEELSKGKMFGVLVVLNKNKELRWLAAFSGNLAHQNKHSFFVPPVFDLLHPKGFFIKKEKEITAINHQIIALETSPTYLHLKQQYQTQKRRFDEKLKQEKLNLKQEKQKRDLLRKALQACEKQEYIKKQQKLIQKSQFQKAEFQRFKKTGQKELATIEKEFLAIEDKIAAMKNERKQQSASLQTQLFEQFSFFNARGERKDLNAIFQQTVQKTPPAGAGECAAPKLLQYAFTHDLHPLCMAEFWWGTSPQSVIRHHGSYYPSCQGKCKPILGHMLQGLEVDPNPLAKERTTIDVIHILYEDDYLAVIDKPAGLLSVPGKSNQFSIGEWAKEAFPEAEAPSLVHRLDMATSGLLLIAKQPKIHKALQAQFLHHTIRKQYKALVEGKVQADEGTIDLPISPDYLNRPCQKLDFEHGKKAITYYKVIKQDQNRTLLALFPLTGRTHQLRLHTAHPLGLGMPIVGDELYGHKAERLYLDAQRITFIHPVTHKKMNIEKKSPF